MDASGLLLTVIVFGLVWARWIADVMRLVGTAPRRSSRI